MRRLNYIWLGNNWEKLICFLPGMHSIKTKFPDFEIRLIVERRHYETEHRANRALQQVHDWVSANTVRVVYESDTVIVSAPPQRQHADQNIHHQRLVRFYNFFLQRKEFGLASDILRLLAITADLNTGAKESCYFDTDITPAFDDNNPIDITPFAPFGYHKITFVAQPEAEPFPKSDILYCTEAGMQILNALMAFVSSRLEMNLRQLYQHSGEHAQRAQENFHARYHHMEIGKRRDFVMYQLFFLITGPLNLRFFIANHPQFQLNAIPGLDRVDSRVRPENYLFAANFARTWVKIHWPVVNDPLDNFESAMDCALIPPLLPKQPVSASESTDEQPSRHSLTLFAPLPQKVINRSNSNPCCHIM